MIAELVKIECIVEHPHDYDKAIILVAGEPLTPDDSLKVWRHSPTGFAWGYGGSGPAQLALAILLQVGVEPEEAVRLHQDFKRQFIEPLPQDRGWTILFDTSWVGVNLAAKDKGSYE